MSAPDACTARKKLRPIRPKPLIPTRTVTGLRLLRTSFRALPLQPEALAQQPTRPTGTVHIRPPRPISQLTSEATVRPYEPRYRSGRFASAVVRRCRQAGSSISGVRLASVFGMPRSAARLSAIASRRRIRPATASLVSGRLVQLAELLEAGLLVLQPQLARHLQVVRYVVAEDLQRPLDPRTRRHRRAGGTAQVGVVEVRQPVRGRAHLAAHPPLLPGEHRLVRTQPGQQRTDRVAVADHHAVHVAHLAGLRRRYRAAGPHRPGPAPPPDRGRSPRATTTGRARSASRAPGTHRARPPPRRRRHRTRPPAADPGPDGRGCPPGRSGGPARHRRGRRGRRTWSACGYRTGRSPPRPTGARRSRRCPCAAGGRRPRCPARPRPRSGRTPGAVRPRTAARTDTSALRQQGFGDLDAGQLGLHLCCHRHEGILPPLSKTRHRRVLSRALRGRPWRAWPGRGAGRSGRPRCRR